MAKLDTQELIDEVKQAKVDVEGNADLETILKELVQGLNQKRSLMEISAKFDKAMSMYLMSHKFVAPHSMIELQEQLKKYSEEYQGAISLSTSLSIF